MTMTRLFVVHLHTSYPQILPIQHTEKFHMLLKRILLFQLCIVSALKSPFSRVLNLNFMTVAPTHVAAMLVLMLIFRNVRSVMKIDSERMENHGNNSHTSHLSRD